MKIACFADIHFGKGSDSSFHNEECLKFIDWFCGIARERKVDKIVFAGDWFDNRIRLRLDTLSFALKGMERIASVAPVVAIVGNHDMFLKDSRDIHSLEVFKEWNSVKVVDDPVVIDGIGYVPFGSAEEMKSAIASMKVPYLFGHFEIPGFLMNSTMEAHENGHYTMDSFKSAKVVFSGHFHKRQFKKNAKGVGIQYIGSPFGHDFNDVNDAERGMMVWEIGEKPEFIDYEDGPLFQRFSLKTIIDAIAEDERRDLKQIRKNSIVEINDTEEFTVEEIEILREEVMKIVGDVRIKQSKPLLIEEGNEEIDMEGKTLSDIVLECLKKVDSRRDHSVDNSLLIQLWERLQ